MHVHLNVKPRRLLHLLFDFLGNGRCFQRVKELERKLLTPFFMVQCLGTGTNLSLYYHPSLFSKYLFVLEAQ